MSAHRPSLGSRLSRVGEDGLFAGLLASLGRPERVLSKDQDPRKFHIPEGSYFDPCVTSPTLPAFYSIGLLSESLAYLVDRDEMERIWPFGYTVGSLPPGLQPVAAEFFVTKFEPEYMTMHGRYVLARSVRRLVPDGRFILDFNTARDGFLNTWRHGENDQGTSDGRRMADTQGESKTRAQKSASYRKTIRSLYQELKNDVNSLVTAISVHFNTARDGFLNTWRHGENDQGASDGRGMTDTQGESKMKAEQSASHLETIISLYQELKNDVNSLVTAISVQPESYQVLREETETQTGASEGSTSTPV